MFVSFLAPSLAPLEAQLLTLVEAHNPRVIRNVPSSAFPLLASCSWKIEIFIRFHRYSIQQTGTFAYYLTFFLSQMLKKLRTFACHFGEVATMEN